MESVTALNLILHITCHMHGSKPQDIHNVFSPYSIPQSIFTVIKDIVEKRVLVVCKEKREYYAYGNKEKIYHLSEYVPVPSYQSPENKFNVPFYKEINLQ